MFLTKKNLFSSHFVPVAVGYGRFSLSSGTVRPPLPTPSSVLWVTSSSSVGLRLPLDVDINTWVILLGIDSRYNEGCTELAKYLFYGLYGRNPLSVEHVLEEFPEDLLDGEFWSPYQRRFSRFTSSETALPPLQM